MERMNRPIDRRAIDKKVAAVASRRRQSVRPSVISVVGRASCEARHLVRLRPSFSGYFGHSGSTKVQRCEFCSAFYPKSLPPPALPH
ncbi:hypothetical protein F0562_034635 [Nyssa sinensis]|uniref:Uncharacterized protein n=1 Tax=Nyssa sinensis TaxID=561372 RepID=A0A5J5AB44_9ASTE|nr:hypothetical protein F0562_034635 [Nyssa sinensis]